VFRELQPECCHFLSVAYEQHIAGQHRVILGLTLDRLEAREFRGLVGGSRNQGQFACLR
jgi:hypothetical protein